MQQLSADEGRRASPRSGPRCRAPTFLARPGEARQHHALGSLLEDPVGRDREDEEDADERSRVRSGRCDGRDGSDLAVREALEPLLDADQDLVLDPVGVLAPRRPPPWTSARADRLLGLVEGARDDQPEQEARSHRRTRRSGCDARARGMCALSWSQSTPGRIAEAMISPSRSSARISLICQSASARDHGDGHEGRDERLAGTSPHRVVLAPLQRLCETAFVRPL